MKLSVLICTMDERIRRVPDILQASRGDVEYVVSWQYTDFSVLDMLPAVLRSRTDVTVCPLSGRGLSLNRNNALEHAQGDLCLIADDDMRYCDDAFDNILHTFGEHPDVDVAQFQVKSYDGRWLKNYASQSYVFRPDDTRCVYPSSVELVLRREAWRRGLRFNPHLGLGAAYLTAGEEEVLLADAVALGMQVSYFPCCIARTDAACTGGRFPYDAGVQRAKGAVFYRRFGLWEARWRCVREALSWGVRKGCNPFQLWHHMMQGIRYIRKTDESR